MTITTAERPHGYARYKMDGCRCYPCCFAVSEYERNRQARIAAGTWRADAEPVRVHLRSLMTHGMGYKRIAARAGVSVSTVARILYGRRGTPPPDTISYDLAQRLLAVPFDPHPTSHVEATGTVRRVQALVAIGHTITAIARAAGCSVGRLSEIVALGSVPYAANVEARTAAAIARLYDQWSMTVPTGTTAERARLYAARRGWPPPLAWDDDDLDNPAATAHTNAVRKATA